VAWFWGVWATVPKEEKAVCFLGEGQAMTEKGEQGLWASDAHKKTSLI